MQATVPVVRGNPVRTPDNVEAIKSMEKDATEVELEKLLFGDDGGFYESLRSHKDTANVGGSAFLSDTREVDHAVDRRHGDLEGVHDEDVCLWISLHLH